MSRNNNASIKNGDNNLINTGDVNINNYNSNPGILNRTRLYEFCEQFSFLDDLYEPDYSFELPSDISDKISYNELDEYNEIFKDVSHTLDDVENILSNIPKRGSIIKKIKGIYLNCKIDNKDKSKDQLCKLVFHKLLEQLNYTNSEASLYEEDTYFAIQCLMYYSFTKCQILDRITI